jgi:hypothetical protein
MLRRHRAVLALVAWTFFVWTTRIGNIWRDADLDTSGKVGRTVLALSFTLLAAAVVVALWRRARWTHAAVLALAGWTVGVWLVRDAGILAADHDVGFKVVHTVLAIVSIVLSVLAWRETGPAKDVRSPGEREPAGHQG